MYLLTFFNVFFTFWPIVLYSIFDLELPISELQKKPRMYSDGRKRFKLTLSLWLKHQAEAILVGSVIFVLTIWLSGNNMTPDGKVAGIWLQGALCYTAVICSVTWKVLAESNTINWVIIILDFASIGVYFLCYWLEALFPIFSIYGHFDQSF